MFRPSSQAQLRDDLITLIRQYVAARWLRRVLISNNVTADDVQCRDLRRILTSNNVTTDAIQYKDSRCVLTGNSIAADEVPCRDSRHVLTDNITAEDIECSILHISRRWFLLREFINVL